MNFNTARTKLSIGSLDDLQCSLSAQYNPKELPVSKPVSWHDAGTMAVEYAGRASREISIELLFDGFEAGKSVMTQLLVLDTLTSPQDWSSPRGTVNRPHRCVVTWGDKMERFTCVITSFDTKFVMWNEDGMPVRAIATVKLKEFDVENQARSDAKAAQRYKRA